MHFGEEGGALAELAAAADDVRHGVASVRVDAQAERLMVELLDGPLLSISVGSDGFAVSE
jgi:hypothetical protein